MERLTMVNGSVFSVNASKVATLKIDMSKLIRDTETNSVSADLYCHTKWHVGNIYCDR